jgi:large subunit ribosomal protein L24
MAISKGKSGNNGTAKGGKREKRTSLIRKGDTVMVIAGGNGTTRQNKGKTGKILKFVGANRVIVEGLNMMTKHQRAQGPDKPAGKIQKEASLHVSNVMFFVEKLKRPVRLKSKILADGKKVRGFLNPETKSFEEIAATK